MSVSGESLPPLPDTGPDPAVGMPAPTVRGQGLSGNALHLGAPGQPTAIVLLAHWCPHCQAEVPELMTWLEGGGLPGGARIVAVSTLADPQRPNYPPSRWFEREGWTVPTMLDDEADSVAEAFGLTGTPFWVLVDGDGRVAGRSAGRLPTSALGTALDDLLRG